MNVSIPPGAPPLRGDIVLSAILRSDIVPIPESIEVTVRWDVDLLQLIKEGKLVKAGRNDSLYKIVKVAYTDEAQGQQAARPYGNITFIALIDNCQKIGVRRDSAVYKEGTTFASVYAACGSTAPIGKNVPLDIFGCLIGEYPSIPIARVLQEEQTTVFWDGHKLNFFRNGDLFSQKPLQIMATDTTEDIKTKFSEKHLIPSFYSTDKMGGIIWGEKKPTSNTRFICQTCPIQLRNLGHVLVNTKILKSYFAPQLHAGGIIKVVKKKFVIMTAVHTYAHRRKESFSKIWLGELK